MSHQILNGNEIIIQGGLEAGFSLYTGYPGSPLAEFFNILYARKEEFKSKGIRVVIANSEANAAAMASGSKQAGRDCLVAMKSMGLHVASDALSVGNFANPGVPYTDELTGETLYPGTVVTVGDDPWSMSTSTAADSRYLYKHLHMSFLEPSTPQELKDWMKKALYISKRTSLYQGLLLTTFMAEGGGRVEVYDEAKVDGDLVTLDPSKFDLSKNVMVPPNSLLADITMIKERFPQVKKVLKEMALDKTFGKLDSEIGFISSGVIFESVKQIFEEAQYLEHFSLYKVASSFPLVDDLLVPYLKGLKKLVVIEEKRGFLETEVKELCQKHGIEIEVQGKEFVLKDSESASEGFPAYGGLSYEIIRDKMEILLRDWGFHACEELKFEEKGYDGILPRRLPTFCPGCPHRETLSLLKDLRAWLKSQGIELITHGDVGCYSLSFLPPFKEMHNLSAMGQGGALGAGVDLFTENPSVVLMGDSTFFHSGVTDISNSVQMDHDITYILLDNDNTAMTGHQMTAASGVNVEGTSRPRQNIASVVKGLGVTDITEVNPSDRFFYQNLMRDFVKRKGTKVIISNKECSLTFHGRERATERKVIKESGVVPEKNFYQINTLACEDCRVCVDNTGCPGLTQTFDAYGPKVTIDPQICVADSYCTKLKACPSFEMVKVVNYHPSKYKSDLGITFNFDHLEDVKPKKDFDAIASDKTWRMVVTGVGGSGITTISKIISKAAVEMGGRDDLDFKFMDQKGLAQRNGNVTGHLSVCKATRSMGAVTPRATADVLLSPDLLDGTGQLGFLANDGVAIFDCDFQVPLTILLDKEVESKSLSKESLINNIKNSHDDRIVTIPLKKWCDKLLGKSVYASTMILGYAFELGLVPFSKEDIAKALDKAIKKNEVSQNLIAFNLGREMCLLGVEKFESKYEIKESAEGYQALAQRSLIDSLLPWESKKSILSSFNSLLESAKKSADSFDQEHLIQMLHDQFIYNRGKNSARFVNDLEALKNIFKGEELEIAIRTIAKTYIVKDEVLVSHLMVSPILQNMDNKLYGNLGTSFKKVRINRPAFDIFNKKVEFDLSPKNWMLKTMRHARFLRVLLPKWHSKERLIGETIRNFIMNEAQNSNDKRRDLKLLENIKGYREVRYTNAKSAFEKLGVNL